MPSKNAKEIFFSAIENYEPSQWRAYLDGVCAGDQDLRNELDLLLAAHQQTDAFLDQRTATAYSEVDLEEGSHVGSYKLLQKIGEGGFGVVFMAEQSEPVRRKVALKVIKPGMDSKEVVARFEAERQALAMMDHPNIAKVLDAGTTEQGLPFFAMELVRGVTITEYADANSLTTDERLSLLKDVCRAVHHAHQKGVIHRDLKPSNVLVTLHDGNPVPKVIDFGISKAISQPLTERTLFTRFGQVVGTPQYMSPEQAELSGLDVDTRSDVYSLGVVLYELLTGRPPFLSEAIRKAGFDEMRRIIREEDPQRPSNVLQTMDADTATSVANKRSVRPEALRRLIRGELDWIVMRALEKDRNRRYDSPGDLAEDINRYLQDAPVEANPPSFIYRLQKSFRRNKILYVSAAAIAIALTLGTAIAVQSARIAEAARYEAFKQEQKAKNARKRAEDAAAAARDEADIARRTLNVLVGVFSMTTTNPKTGSEFTVREALSGLAELETDGLKSKNKLKTPFGELALPANVVAQLNMNLGATLLKEQEFFRASQHFKAAAAATLEVHDKESVSYSRCLRMWGAASGKEDRILQAINIERKLNETQDLASSLLELGKLQIQKRNVSSAVEPLGEATRLFKIHSKTSIHDSPHLYLAAAFRILKEDDKATELELETLKSLKKMPAYSSMNHNDLLNLGKEFSRDGKFTEAEVMYRLSASMTPESTYFTNYYRASICMDTGRLDEAHQLLIDALDQYMDENWKGMIRNKLVQNLLLTGKLEAAKQLLWDVVEAGGTNSVSALLQLCILESSKDEFLKRLGPLREGFPMKMSSRNSSSRIDLAVALDSVKELSDRVQMYAKLLQRRSFGETPWPSIYLSASFNEAPRLINLGHKFALLNGGFFRLDIFLGRASYHLHDFGKAQRHFNDALAKSKASPIRYESQEISLLSEIIRLQLARGNMEEARKQAGELDIAISQQANVDRSQSDSLEFRSSRALAKILSSPESIDAGFEMDLQGSFRLSETSWQRTSFLECLAALAEAKNDLPAEIKYLELASLELPLAADSFPNYFPTKLVGAYKRGGQVARGIEHFEKLIDKYDHLHPLHPQRAFIRLDYAELLLEIGNMDSTLQAELAVAEKILKHHEGTPKHVLDRVTSLISASN